MSKYNDYGKKLNKAMLAFREKYIKALNEVREAEKAVEESNHPGVRPYGVNGLGWDAEVADRKYKASLRLSAAKANFEKVERESVNELNQTRSDLTKNLREEVAEDTRANPDALDNNALKLLDSGIMGIDDYAGFIQKYDDNPTMLRMLSKYMKTAADGIKSDDRAGDRGRLYQMARECEEGKNSTLRTWDSLCNVVDYCSGQVHENNTPSYVQGMSERWEQLSTAAMESL